MFALTCRRVLRRDICRRSRFCGPVRCGGERGPVCKHLSTVVQWGTTTNQPADADATPRNHGYPALIWGRRRVHAWSARQRRDVSAAEQGRTERSWVSGLFQVLPRSGPASLHSFVCHVIVFPLFFPSFPLPSHACSRPVALTGVTPSPPSPPAPFIVG